MMKALRFSRKTNIILLNQSITILNIIITILNTNKIAINAPLEWKILTLRPRF
jgi:hypothetical protein